MSSVCWLVGGAAAVWQQGLALWLALAGWLLAAARRETTQFFESFEKESFVYCLTVGDIKER